MTRPTNDDISKMDKDEIAFSKISYGVTPDSFDLIINYKSAKQIWDILKNIYEGIEHAQDKKLTTSQNESNNFKSLPSESLDHSFKRFNLIVTKLSNAGITRSDHEIYLYFLNGLGKQWTMAKMIVQGDSKIKNLSLYKLYGELEA